MIKKQNKKIIKQANRYQTRATLQSVNCCSVHSREYLREQRAQVLKSKGLAQQVSQPLLHPAEARLHHLEVRPGHPEEDPSVHPSLLALEELGNEELRGLVILDLPDLRESQALYYSSLQP